jgi:DNA-binding CsgD family transcriptional regulator
VNGIYAAADLADSADSQVDTEFALMRTRNHRARSRPPIPIVSRVRRPVEDAASGSDILVIEIGERDGVVRTLSEAMPEMRVRAGKLNGHVPDSVAVVVWWGGFAINAPPLPRRASGDPVPALVIAVNAREEDELAALDAGFDGYLPERLPTTALRAAIHGVLRGEFAYRRDVLGKWLRSNHRVRHRDLASDPLTRRQREVIELIAGGATDKEIAATLGIRVGTAQKHVARLLHRLKVPNRASAVATYRDIPKTRYDAGGMTNRR